MTRTLALALLALTACDPGAVPPPGEEVASKAQRITAAAPDADVAAAVNSNTALGLELLARHPDGNFLLSSYSITAAASLLSAGAGGDTLRGIETALQQTLPAAQHHRAMNTLEAAVESRGANAKGKDGKPFRLVVSNQLFAQKGQHLESAYLDTLAQEYGAGLRLLDFSTDAARQSINTWVSQRTEGKIAELFERDSLLGARLAVVNTLYFNAAWAESFAAANTTRQPFTLLDGSQASVSMMRNRRLTQARSAIVDGTQVLELPYDGGDVSLVVLAPSTGQFETFARGLDAATVATLVAALQIAPHDVSLPKFNFATELQLRTELQSLGMVDAFAPDKADFSGMTGDRSLYVDEAIHKAVIALDESGTEAAAATGFSTRAVSLPPEPVVVVIDRPFLFFIRDVKTGLMLFTGRVVNPG